MTATELPQLESKPEPTELLVTVTELVANREGVDRMELPPLGGEIDVDGLMLFFEHAPAWEEDGTTALEFDYIGHTIRIANDGTLELVE